MLVVFLIFASILNSLTSLNGNVQNENTNQFPTLEEHEARMSKLNVNAKKCCKKPLVSNEITQTVQVYIESTR